MMSSVRTRLFEAKRATCLTKSSDLASAGELPMTDLLIPMTDVDALKAAGIHYPATEYGWRWCFRHRHVRGLDNAFKRNGRRIVVDVEAFKAAVRNRAR